MTEVFVSSRTIQNFRCNKIHGKSAWEVHLLKEVERVERDERMTLCNRFICSCWCLQKIHLRLSPLQMLFMVIAIILMLKRYTLCGYKKCTVMILDKDDAMLYISAITRAKQYIYSSWNNKRTIRINVCIWLNLHLLLPKELIDPPYLDSHLHLYCRNSMTAVHFL